MSTSTRRIVVAYDGSPDSDEAARWAAGIALLRGESIVALVVVEPMDSPRSQGWPSSRWDEVEQRAADTFGAAGASEVTVQQRVGKVVPTLLDAARDASMLVFGSRGHGRVGEIVSGSASQSAARRSRCPVVVVRERSAAMAHRIVVGSDDSEPSRRALDFGCELAARAGQQVVMLRARKPSTVPVDRHAPSAQSPTLLEAQETLAKSVAEQRGRFPDLDIVGEFVDTDAAQALVDASYTATMVAVGSRGRSALTETVLGSVSHHVLHEAHCPVAVVR